MITQKLITKAYYLSNVVSADIETVSGSQILDGLEMLNTLLSEQTAAGEYLPYYSHIKITAVTDQEEYEVPNLILLEDMTFNIDDVRYPMYQDNRTRYWGTSRLDNIKSLPFHYYVERTLGGSRFFVYFKPISDIDVFNLTGRFSLGDVTLNEELNDKIFDFYQNYLRYLLAKRICDEYDMPFSASKEKVLSNLQEKCLNVNPLDLSMRKISTLDTNNTLNFAQINIGRGWRP